MSNIDLAKLDTKILDAVARRVVSQCDVLGEISDTPNSLTRTFCSDAMKRAHVQVQSWMEAIAMTCRVDAVGNLVGTFASGDAPKSSVFMIGSHLDTVFNAGKFDGALGALLGLGVVDVIREIGVELPFDIDVVGFSEEEGVRFRFPFIGSLGITGKFDPGDFDREDSQGITLREALVQFGCNPDDLDVDTTSSRRHVVGFMEAHLEQATRLELAGIPVGVVSSIAGQTRATIVLDGTPGHAGTVPHGQRHDALTGAAKLILDIEELGQTTAGLFATVGSISALPGLSNVIPGRVELRLDLRHENDEVREGALRTIELMIRELGLKREIIGRIHSASHTPAVPMDDKLTLGLLQSAAQVQGKVQAMVSGAGHDAMVMAKFAPSCMLFVRCRDGVSHHPDEYVSPEDIRVALEVMTNAVLELARNV